MKKKDYQKTSSNYTYILIRWWINLKVNIYQFNDPLFNKVPGDGIELIYQFNDNDNVSIDDE